MKKFYTIAALALSSLAANAQQTLNLSTYLGTDLTNYDKKTVAVTVNRYIFNGWNTIALPFNLSTSQIEQVFGADCQVEKLAGVENDGTGIKLNFQDCKAEGIKANTPYILKYTGETGTKTIKAENALVSNATASVSFTVANTGEVVTFAAAKEKKDAKGLYGILAKDNSEASFVNVDNISNGFYATRCYIQISSGNSAMLSSNHIQAGDATDIRTVARDNEIVDVYSVSGSKIASSIKASEVNSLTNGIYVVKGKKVYVK